MDSGRPPMRETLSQLRLRELLLEVQDRIEQIVEGRDRLDGLVEAILVITSGLKLDATLRAIVHTAIELVDARHGALGVRGSNQEGHEATMGPLAHRWGPMSPGESRGHPHKFGIRSVKCLIPQQNTGYWLVSTGRLNPTRR